MPDIAGKEIIIVGLGAGGSQIVHFLTQYLNFHSQDNVVVLVDGDTFESRNEQNQRFRRMGNKAEVKRDELREDFPNVRFRAMATYVHEENVVDIIPEDAIVFMCVDNHRTRSLINRHCQGLANVVLINGGVENYDGDVWIYIRRNGRDITPDMTYRHPEIAQPTDTAPFEKSCEQVMQSDPARIFSVLAVVDWMIVAFGNYLSDKVTYYQIYIDTTRAQIRKVLIPDEYKLI